MKLIFYELLRWYVRLGLKLYFRKIVIHGLEHIPKEKPVLFTANHQNAFLDALLIVAFNKRYTYFLARASIFSNALAKTLLSLINIMPIYRIRDGKHTLTNNEAIFQQCYKILNEGNTIIIFPEGNHDMRRKLRPLSKGFTRIVNGALEHTPLKELEIMPVGLNYEHHQKYRSAVSIFFGKPIKIAENVIEKPMKLRATVAERIKTIITHIDDENYLQVARQLDEAQVDYLDPKSVNYQIINKKIIKKVKRKHNLLRKLLYPPVFINNLIVVSLWSLILKTIKDPVFVGSIKFTFGLFIVPLIYVMQSVFIGYFFGYIFAILYLAITILSAPILSKTR